MGSPRQVWIIWNEAMTQGIVLTDQAQAEEILLGIYTAGDLTEAFVNLHGEDVMTFDPVKLTVET